jgi:hypothetical protein
MDRTRSSETFVDCNETTWCYIPEDARLHGVISQKMRDYMVLCPRRCETTWCYIPEDARLYGVISQKMRDHMVLYPGRCETAWCYIPEDARLHGVISHKMRDYMVLYPIRCETTWCYISEDALRTSDPQSCIYMQYILLKMKSLLFLHVHSMRKYCDPGEKHYLEMLTSSVTLNAKKVVLGIPSVCYHVCISGCVFPLASVLPECLVTIL